MVLSLEIEKVDVFRKVLNKQFIERLRAICIINKTQLQTPTDCFSPWGNHQGNLIQFCLNKVPLMIPQGVKQSVGVCNGIKSMYFTNK